jgi:hypothetical protein
MKFERTSAISKGLGNALQLIADINGLPPIRGSWFFVDPLSGSDNADGRTIDTALAGIRAAYDKCISSAGDGIAFLSRASATSADTTSYLGGSLIWAKHNITVAGVGGGPRYNKRCRIASVDRAYAASTLKFTTTGGVYKIEDSAKGLVAAGFQVGDAVLATAAAGTAITVINKVTAIEADGSAMTLATAVTENLTPGASIVSTHCAPVCAVTGRGNRFRGISFVNNGITASDLGALSVQGDDNQFEEFYCNGATVAALAGAAVGQFDLEVAASELLFKDGVCGSNATLWAAANARINLGSGTKQIGQVFFENVKVVTNSATPGHGAVKIVNAATFGGWIDFDDKCSFTNWQSGAVTALTAAIIGTDTDNMGIFCDARFVGWAILVDAAWDNVYTSRAVAAAHGGRGILDE